MRTLLLIGAGLPFAYCASLYHHKARQASIILGSTLYIDGGELTTWDGTGSGSYGGTNFTINEDINTYSIDLTQPWSNSSVAITTIPKTTRAFQSGALWANASGQAFYSYDGGISLAYGRPASVPANQLLAYTPKGRWTETITTGNFSALQRVQEGTYASGNGLGFALGGFRSRATIQPSESLPSVTEYQAGMVVYNTSSQSWYNVSAGGYYNGKTGNGAAQFVPNFGPAGLFLAFGGAAPNDTVLPLDRTSVYEPTSQQWRLQQTTGDIPPGVQNACAVGAAGDNGTYEIYVFGGLQGTVDGFRAADGSVYILSLPSFHWFQVSAAVLGRHKHSCNVVGRQMISIGGIVLRGSVNASTDAMLYGIPDPWPNGLGVYDMSSLQWNSQFDPNAAAYVTPNVVKTHIASAGATPSSWADPTIQSWFATRKDSNYNSSVSPSSDGGSSDGGSSDGGSLASSSGVSKGAIAGAVVGAVVGVTLIAALAFWLVRRNKKAKQEKYDETSYAAYAPVKSPFAQHGDNNIASANGMYEAVGDHAHELNQTRGIHSTTLPYETSGQPVYELDLSNQHQTR